MTLVSVSPTEATISSVQRLQLCSTTANGHESSKSPRTELDSHANMAVVGRNCVVFDGIHGKTCEVEPFDPSIGVAKKVPIVDAAIAYDCPFSIRTYIFILRNALYVKNLDHNLIPPFLLREAGIEINEKPKIHTQNPTVDDHAIIFTEVEPQLRIPLNLCGVFSFFHTRVPMADEIEHCDVLFLTPDSHEWNPYSTHFSSNEESMLDWEGNMQKYKYQKKHIIDLSPDGVTNYGAMIDSAISSAYSYHEESVPLSYNELNEFAQLLGAKTEVSKFAMSIGSITSSFSGTCDLFQPINDYIKDFTSKIDSAMASKPKTISPEFLSKIWHIKPDLATKVLNQTTQLQRQGVNNELSRHYSTNDRMLRY